MAHGTRSSTPQIYGNVHAFRVDQNPLSEMGAHISVPVARVVEQIDRWIETPGVWNEEWLADRESRSRGGYLDY